MSTKLSTMVETMKIGTNTTANKYTNEKYLCKYRNSSINDSIVEMTQTWIHD